MTINLFWIMYTDERNGISTCPVIHCIRHMIINFKATLVFFQAYNDQNTNLYFIFNKMPATLGTCIYINLFIQAASSFSIQFYKYWVISIHLILSTQLMLSQALHGRKLSVLVQKLPSLSFTTVI